MLHIAAVILLVIRSVPFADRHTRAASAKLVGFLQSNSLAFCFTPVKSHVLTTSLSTERQYGQFEHCRHQRHCYSTDISHVIFIQWQTQTASHLKAGFSYSTHTRTKRLLQNSRRRFTEFWKSLFTIWYIVNSNNRPNSFFSLNPCRHYICHHKDSIFYKKSFARITQFSWLVIMYTKGQLVW